MFVHGSQFENEYVNNYETLRTAMTQNPKLEVLLMSGYYDLATPYFAADYTFSHLGLNESLQDNINVEYYEGGHMMYVHLPSLAKMKDDMVEFYVE